MLLSNEEVEARLTSPLNLLNRLRTSNEGLSLFGVEKSSNGNHPAAIPALPPPIEELIENVEDKVKLGSAHKEALELMVASMTELHKRLPEVQKAKDLSTIAADMNRILTNIEQSKNNKIQTNQQVVIYKPIIMSESHFEVIHANE